MPIDKSRIKDALLFICTNAQAGRGQLARLWSRNNISISLSVRGELRFAEAIREILKNPLVLENFSVREIEEEVEDIISRTLQLPRSQRQTSIESEVNSLFALLSRQIRDYQFIIPISNLKISRKFKIGNVKFKIFTQYQLQKWAKMFRDILRNNPRYTDKQKKKFVRSIKERSLNPLKDISCAEIIVKARTKRAREIALSKVNEALDIIKLYCLVERGPHGSNVGLPGEILSSSIRSILAHEIRRGSLSPTLERVGPLFSLEIDDKLVKMMYKYGVKKLNQILLKKKKSWVERKILRAIYWFSRIYDTPLQRMDDEKILIKRGMSTSKKEEMVEYGRINERFVKAMVSLESLLIIGKRESVQNNIAERAAFVLETDCKKRRSVKKLIKRLYGLRSEVVHHGFTYISIGELKQLISLVRSTIIALILKKDRLGLKSQEDFYNYFEKKKFS